MSKNKYGFKFAIGQVVKPVDVDWDKVTALQIDEEKKGRSLAWGETRKRHAFRVVSRILEECYGGIQRHYHVRPLYEGGAVGLQMIKMVEVELEDAITS